MVFQILYRIFFYYVYIMYVIINMICFIIEEEFYEYAYYIVM